MTTEIQLEYRGIPYWILEFVADNEESPTYGVLVGKYFWSAHTNYYVGIVKEAEEYIDDMLDSDVRPPDNLWKESPDDPVVTNEQGGKQSEAKFNWYDFPFDTYVSLTKNGVSGPLAFVSDVLETGAEKYGHLNWHNIPTEDHINHMVHHAISATQQDTNEEVEVHLTHAVCRALFALYTMYQ